MRPSIDPASRFGIPETLTQTRQARRMSKENQERNGGAGRAKFALRFSRILAAALSGNCRDRNSGRIGSPKESRIPPAGACLNGCRFADRFGKT